ncbi:MAG: hypothetical protein JSV83_24340 [Desulfobacterales bacterium]|nr:MAG: hypothetical protein JSV83_24340 [Desulfobacterales bacterium]
MNEEAENKQLIERIKILQTKRNEILSLPPEKAMDRILDDPHAVELVHSFPEQDFYLLIHDIGPEDALPLLSLASNKQWEHIVDLETWQRDRIDIKIVTRWMNLLLEADPQRFLRWALEEKLEFVEFYLYKNIEVRVREHDQDPSEFGDDFFSLDGVYYVRFIEAPAETETDKLSDEQRREFINKLTERLSDFDHRTYQNVLLEATHVLPAETEENNYRWRNVRLAEKGFLPFDEAIGIYQPIKPRDLKKQRAKQFLRSMDYTTMLPVPQYPLKVLKEDNHFTRALAAIEPAALLQQVQTEFANLCNQIIVADHKTIREREALREIVRKACGYISIGLERLSDDEKKVDPHRAAALIARHPLSQIFKVGFGGALELKWRVEKWISQCWFAQAGLRLTFWGEQWLGVLGGLLLKKPLFYDNYETGVLYREFASLEEIRETENVFNQIKTVDELLSLMAINLASPSSYGFLTYKNLILTLWARHYLGLSAKKVQPITLKQFNAFYESLLPGQPHPDAETSRRIPMQMKASFLGWLSEDTGLKDYEITESVGQTFENLFNEIENEYGRVAAKDLDPRYVHLFLLAPKPSKK